jgi:hypothetical protein
MDDYHSILAKAVRGLDRNTAAARRRLYKRAHSALLSEMQNAYPRIPRSEIMIAQMALDTAIGQVEAEAALVALEKSVEQVERGDAPTVPDTAIERVEEHGRSYPWPKPVAPGSLIPTRTWKPRRLPANQGDRRESLFGIRRLFRWRSPRSTEVKKRTRAATLGSLNCFSARRERRMGIIRISRRNARQTATSIRADVVVGPCCLPLMTRAYDGRGMRSSSLAVNEMRRSGEQRHWGADGRPQPC